MLAWIALVGLGILPIVGCQDFNPYLGAPSTQSSTIGFITPSSRPAGCPGFMLDVQGSGFPGNATVSWNGSPRTTNYESSSELLATINASDVATQGTATVIVSTPELSGQQNQGNNLSNIVTFTVAAPPSQGTGNCPAAPTFPPTFTALSATSGTPTTTIEIAGNYFGGNQGNSTVAFVTTATSASTTASPSSWSGTLIAVPVPSFTFPNNVTSIQTTVVVTVNGVVATPLTPGANLFTVLNPGTSSSVLSSTLASANTARSFAITAGPRYVAFVSPSPDPSSDNGSGVDNIYLRDSCQGAPAGCSPNTIPVSVTFDGTVPNGASSSPSISASGRFVAFASDASNLVQGDSNGATDVFLRDTCIGAPSGCVPSTIRVSTGPDGIEANGPSTAPSISPDGRFVAFDSVATNLVSDGQGPTTGNSEGSFLWDSCFGVTSACTPSLTRLSVTSPTLR